MIQKYLIIQSHCHFAFGFAANADPKEWVEYADIENFHSGNMVLLGETHLTTADSKTMNPLSYVVV